MARTLQEKNALECNKRARAKYNKTYNEKMGLKYMSIRIKEEDAREIEDYCERNSISKATLIRNVVLDYIRNN